VLGLATVLAPVLAPVLGCTGFANGNECLGPPLLLPLLGLPTLLDGVCFAFGTRLCIPAASKLAALACSEPRLLGEDSSLLNALGASTLAVPEEEPRTLLGFCGNVRKLPPTHSFLLGDNVLTVSTGTLTFLSPMLGVAIVLDAEVCAAVSKLLLVVSTPIALVGASYKPFRPGDCVLFKELVMGYVPCTDVG